MKKKPSSRSLADIAADVFRPLAEKHGFATAQIMIRWAELAGSDLAYATKPLRVKWPPTRELQGNLQETAPQHRGATLFVVCESARALDLQFAAPAIMERVNLLYGWQAITRLAIRQGPVEPGKKKLPAQKLEKAPADLVKNLERIDDPDLKEALSRLASGIARARRCP